MNVPDYVVPYLSKLIGLACRRFAIGSESSLGLSFGNELESPASKRIRGRTHEWEIGSFHPNWRVVRGGKVLLGALDDYEHDGASLPTAAQFGALASIDEAECGDVMLSFDTGYQIQFVSLFAEPDEYFHVFCPEGMFVQAHASAGWEVGRSDVPW